MNSLPILENTPSLYVNRNVTSVAQEGDLKMDNVISLYKSTYINYQNLPLEEKWRYRRAVNELQILINKIQSEESSSFQQTQYNLPEVVNLLKIRKEMLSIK